MGKEITEMQRERFSKTFRKMMNHADPELQKKWDGTVEWNDRGDYPKIQLEVVQNLSPALRARYVVLLNNLSRGEI
jgi:hypothetical protein